MAKKEIKTSIQINASPERVWNILTDIAQYPNWNPFLTSIEGTLQVGNQIQINADGMQFKPIILVLDQNKEFRWIGKLLVKGLFDGEHIFQIIDHKNGTITFKHEEQFSGLLVGLLAKQLDTDIKAKFVQMNEKLKELAERKASFIG